ncbi:MAG: nucleotidyltransferase domain-containing protein [Candidatus Tectomicrobia bacterium]|uniref:Nucleotidyltransferase domain-containing protein n=1 Tax=Tectimicrobiota bacterium TaxID=2528274 RepID=A0A932HZ93_UNCTE|nr:nucleotidyltransferase domain-containing protein [Candidatus Tectomicrobia bacterium]
MSRHFNGEKAIAQAADAIVRQADPERIYLFGSRARGEATAESDVDLLVVEREPFGPRRSRLQEINSLYRAISPYRIAADILVFSSEEFARWRNSINHVVGRCEREGKLLYARP